ncbi:MAG: cupin domain-containing protein [Bauldia sp.]
MGIFDRAIVSTRQNHKGRTTRGDAINVIARAGETNGAVGVFGAIIEPGTGPVWHVHAREIEIMHVLSGQFRFWCGTEAFDAGADTTVVLPANVPHRWKNTGTTQGRLLTVVTPGGFEQNFLDLATLPEMTDEAIARIDQRLECVACPAPEGAVP